MKMGRAIEFLLDAVVSTALGAVSACGRLPESKCRWSTNRAEVMATGSVHRPMRCKNASLRP